MKNITKYINESNSSENKTLNFDLSDNYFKNIELQVKAQADLIERFKNMDDFLIIHPKDKFPTKTIKNWSREFKMPVISVFLNIAEPEDLEPIKYIHDGQIKYALPAWLQIIKDNPDQKYLLLFNEIETASQAVLQKLTPFITKHEFGGEKYDNILIGLCGTYKDDNEARSIIPPHVYKHMRPTINLL